MTYIGERGKGRRGQPIRNVSKNLHAVRRLVKAKHVGCEGGKDHHHNLFVLEFGCQRGGGRRAPWRDQKKKDTKTQRGGVRCRESRGTDAVVSQTGKRARPLNREPTVGWGSDNDNTRRRIQERYLLLAVLPFCRRALSWGDG